MQAAAPGLPSHLSVQSKPGGGPSTRPNHSGSDRMEWEPSGEEAAPEDAQLKLAQTVELARKLLDKNAEAVFKLNGACACDSIPAWERWNGRFAAPGLLGERV